MTDQLHLRHGPCLRSSQTDARLNLQSPDKSSTHILDILEQCIWHPSTKMLPSLDRKLIVIFRFLIFGSKLPVPKPKKYQVTRLDPWFFKIYRELIDEGTIKTQQIEKTTPGCLGFLLRVFLNLPTYIRGFFHKPS